MSAGKFGKRFAALAAVLTAGFGLAAAQPADAAARAPACQPVVIQTIGAVQLPEGVAVSPRTGKVYVAGIGGPVSVISGRTGTVTGTIPVGFTTYAVASARGPTRSTSPAPSAAWCG